MPDLHQLVAALHAGDLERVRTMLEARPGLVDMDMASNNEHGALHYAVLDRAPEMVRLLMRHGADARKGIYPHRDATTALTIATDRGYAEIVSIIEDEEQRRRDASTAPDAQRTSTGDELCEAIWRGDSEQAMAAIEVDPPLVHARHRDGWTPIHAASAVLDDAMVGWLLERGADATISAGRVLPDPAPAGPKGPALRLTPPAGPKGPALHSRRDPALTPLDVAASSPRWRQPASATRFAAVAALLRERGAELTPRSAVALGEADWLRARHAEGALVQPAIVDLLEPSDGLLTIAVKHNRPDVLSLLLDLGFDPDERTRVNGLEEEEFSSGMPLWNCAASGHLAMAEMLLRRGANPNAEVYASGTPVSAAYGHGRREKTMIDLLQRHGGVVTPAMAGLYRETELARPMLSDAAGARVDEAVHAGETRAEQMLWGAACGGDPEIVRMALDRVDWRRDDPRWYRMLEQPVRIWNHGPWPWAQQDWDRGTYVTCFRLVLERCDANVRGRFGLTMLHDVAASREYVTADERVAFTTLLLDAGARLDVRDDLLKSTPLGWACRWGRVELVKLLLARGADPFEADAEPWATPRAWAEKKNHDEIRRMLTASQP